MAQAYADTGGCSWREAAQRSNVGFEAARMTTENMVRSGELRPCGQQKVAQGNTWESMYEVVCVAEPSSGNLLQHRVPDLQEVVDAWAKFR